MISILAAVGIGVGSFLLGIVACFVTLWVLERRDVDPVEEVDEYFEERVSDLIEEKLNILSAIRYWREKIDRVGYEARNEAKLILEHWEAEYERVRQEINEIFDEDMVPEADPANLELPPVEAGLEEEPKVLTVVGVPEELITEGQGYEGDPGELQDNEQGEEAPKVDVKVDGGDGDYGPSL